MWHIFEDGNEPSNLNDSGLTAPENRVSTEYTFSAFDSHSMTAQGETATITAPDGTTLTAQGGSASASASATSIVNIRIEWPKTPIIQGTVLRSLNNRYAIQKTGYSSSDTTANKQSGFRPKIEDVNWITGKVGQLTNKWVMYTGDYDNGTLPADSGNVAKGKEATETENTNYTREQNILGEDIYMYDYTCDFSKVKALEQTMGTNDDTDPDLYINTVTAGMIKEYYFGKEDKTITVGKAVQALYKAIGAKKYYVSMFQLNNYKYGATKYKNLMTTETPFINNVQDAYTDVDYKNYWTYIYMSRTQMEYYLQRAYYDGVTEGKEYLKDKSPICTKKDAKTQVKDSTDNITVIQFCHYLKNLLYVNGEPELTDKEASAILTFYGRTLPQGLSEAQLQDVQYLLARGIIDSNLNFNSNLDVPTMMQILMRAADPGSRLTFKQMQVVYDEKLTSQGFFPVDLNLSGTAIKDVKPTADSIKAIGTYDYLVLKSNFTQFSQGNNPYISDTAFETASCAARSSQPLKGSAYMGERGDYYWFKVPVNPPSEAMGTDQNYVTVAFAQKNDSVKFYKLELGGGYYENPQDTKGAKFKYLNRRPFGINQYPSLIDEDSKIRAQNSEDGSVLLADNKTKKFSFKIKEGSVVSFCGIDKASWTNKDLTKDVNKDTFPGYVSFPVVDSKDKTKYTVEIDDSDNNASGKLAELLKVSADGGGSVTYLSYMKTDKTVLADSRLLKDPKAGDAQILSITKISDGTDLAKATYRIETKYENIIVDNEKKKVVRGQSILQFRDTTDLMVPQETGAVSEAALPDFYIDCRVLLGVVDNFLVVNSTSSTKTITWLTSADDVNDINIQAKAKPPYSVHMPIIAANGNDAGSKGNFVLTEAGKPFNKFQLEATYPEANYFVYYTDAEGTSATYLVVLMPKTALTDKYEDAEKRSKKEEFLKQSFGYELNANEYATIYSLQNSEKTKVKVNSLDVPVIALNKQSSITATVQGYGLLYSVPKLQDFDYTSYISGESTTNPLPIVYKEYGKIVVGSSPKENSRFLTLNVNMPTENPNATTSEKGSDEFYKCYRTIYYKTMSSTAQAVFAAPNNDIVFNANGKGYSTEKAQTAPYAVSPAPIGIQRFFCQCMEYKLHDVINNNNGKVFYGSAYGKIKTVGTAGDNAAQFCYSNVTYGLPDYSNYKVLSAFLSPTQARNIFVITDADTLSKLKNSITTAELMSKGLEPVPELTPGGTRKWEFDFKAFDAKTICQNADGVLSVIYYILLTILPLFILFDFLALASLSLVVGKGGPLMWFCCNIVDIFKILSFGVLDVNTVRPWPLWISTFVATIFLAMLNNQSLIQLLNWLSQSLVRLLGH